MRVAHVANDLEANDLEEGGPSALGPMLKAIGLGILTLFLMGFVVGFTAAHLNGTKAITLGGGAMWAGAALAAAGCAWLLTRMIKKTARLTAPATRRERLNRNILVACGLLGGVIGGTMVLANREALEAGNIFNDAPLPAGIALVIVLVLGVVVPALSIYWHRSAVDEQEADAYKTGALYGLYVFMIGAPVWWFAWRGGFAPEPDGPLLYMATVLTVGAVWMWRKYR